MNDLEKLLKLVENYLEKSIDTKTFTSNFTIFFGQEVDYDTLDEKQYQFFCELEDIANLFSPFEEDHLLYPYTREEDVQKKAREVFTALN